MSSVSPQIITPTDSLPISPQSPHSPYASVLLCSARAFFSLSNLALPLGRNPMSQPVLDLFLFDGLPLRYEAGGHVDGSHAGHALTWKDTSLHEGLGRRSVCETPRKTDRYERSSQLA